MARAASSAISDTQTSTTNKVATAMMGMGRW